MGKSKRTAAAEKGITPQRAANPTKNPNLTNQRHPQQKSPQRGREKQQQGHKKNK